MSKHETPPEALPPPTWRIEMLGSLRAVSEPGGIVVRRFRTRRATLLLACLAMRPGAARQRGQLCEMLWPEDDPQVQRNRLRFELSALRSTLGASIFAADCGNAAVALSPAVTSDVAELDALLAQAARLRAAEPRMPLLRRAVALYGGDLLPGLELPEGCPPEFDWLGLERHRLRGAASEAAVRLVTDLQTLGLHEEAARLRREIGAIFPEISAADLAFDPDPVVGVTAPDASARDTRAAPVVLLSGSFFGRDTQLRRLRRWAAGEEAAAESAGGRRGGDIPRRAERLVTILGPGGIGKTRLLIEALSGRADVVLVPLAEIGGEGAIHEAIARSLALPRRPAPPIRDRVVEALRVRPDAILLLDNCEHLIPASARCVTDLLEACPGLRVCATSQRPLGVPGEHTLSLPPLPPRAARELFLDRAHAIRPAFADTPAALAAAEEVVELLGGVPLALELAAARALVLSPGQMRDQLRRRLDSLGGAHPSRPERHRSMRAALRWSVGLLSEPARRTLGFLSLFRTGATIGAIRAVTGEDVTLIDALEELRLCSLLVVRFPADDGGTDDAAGAQETRYDLLFYVRQFAAELLAESDRHAGWERHADFWSEKVAEIPRAFHWGQWDRIRGLLLPDMENIRAAVDGCVRRGLGRPLFRLTNGLGTVLLELGYWEDAAMLLDATEATEQLTQKQTVRMLGLRGALARRRGDEASARAAWARRLELVRGAEDEDADMEATILFDLAAQAIDGQRLEEARSLIDQGTRIAERSPKRFRSAVGGVLEARFGMARGRCDEAAARAEAAWAMAGGLDINPSERLFVLIHLLPIFRACGDQRRVAELARIGLPLAVETGQAFLLARLLDEVAPFWEAHHQHAAAATGLFIAYSIHTELGSRFADRAWSAWRGYHERRGGTAGSRGPFEELSPEEASERARSWRRAVQELLLVQNPSADAPRVARHA